MCSGGQVFRSLVCLVTCDIERDVVLKSRWPGYYILLVALLCSRFTYFVAEFVGHAGGLWQAIPARTFEHPVHGAFQADLVAC